MMWTRWLLDVTNWQPGGPFCFCPEDANGSIVVGMNYIGAAPPAGKLVGIFHVGGQEAVDRWMSEHEVDLADIVARCLKTA